MYPAIENTILSKQSKVVRTEAKPPKKYHISLDHDRSRLVSASDDEDKAEKEDYGSKPGVKISKTTGRVVPTFVNAAKPDLHALGEEEDEDSDSDDVSGKMPGVTEVLKARSPGMYGATVIYEASCVQSTYEASTKEHLGDMHSLVKETGKVSCGSAPKSPTAKSGNKVCKVVPKVASPGLKDIELLAATLAKASRPQNADCDEKRAALKDSTDSKTQTKIATNTPANVSEQGKIEQRCEPAVAKSQNSDADREKKRQQAKLRKKKLKKAASARATIGGYRPSRSFKVEKMPTQRLVFPKLRKVEQRRPNEPLDPKDVSKFAPNELSEISAGEQERRQARIGELKQELNLDLSDIFRHTPAGGHRSPGKIVEREKSDRTYSWLPPEVLSRLEGRRGNEPKILSGRENVTSRNLPGITEEGATKVASKLTAESSGTARNKTFPIEGAKARHDVDSGQARHPAESGRIARRVQIIEAGHRVESGEAIHRVESNEAVNARSPEPGTSQTSPNVKSPISSPFRRRSLTSVTRTKSSRQRKGSVRKKTRGASERVRALGHPARTLTTKRRSKTNSERRR